MVVVTLAVSIMACQVTSGPKPPRAVTVNPEQAMSLEKAIQNPEVNPSSGIVTIRVTESQVSSYLALNFSKETSEFLSNPQILFEPGKVHIYGTLQSSVFPVDGRVISEIILVNKTPQVKIASAEFGFLPVPANLLSSLADQINKAILKDYQKTNPDYQFESIVISTGWATIQMKKK